MPLPLTHFAVGFFAAELILFILPRFRKQRFFSAIAGFGGMVPDLDAVLFLFVSLFTPVSFDHFHRTYSHTLYFPLIFVAVALLFFRHAAFRNAFLFLALGVLTHPLMDSLINGSVPLLYPLTTLIVSRRLIGPQDAPLLKLFALEAVSLLILLAYTLKRGYLREVVAFGRRLAAAMQEKMRREKKH